MRMAVVEDEVREVMGETERRDQSFGSYSGDMRSLVVQGWDFTRKKNAFKNIGLGLSLDCAAPFKGCHRGLTQRASAIYYRSRFLHNPSVLSPAIL